MYYVITCRLTHHQLDNMADITESQQPLTCDNSELYSQTLPYSIDGPLPDGYSEITEEEQLAGYSAVGTIVKTIKEEIPAGYSTIPEAQDASNDGLVYSAVVRQDGIMTTVKTTAQIDEQQQQSVSDTSNDGLVYSAVVVKGGIKTTVKTTAQIDEQQQSVSDTSNDGLVYSAVVVKDGIKITVKTTVIKD